MTSESRFRAQLDELSLRVVNVTPSKLSKAIRAWSTPRPYSLLQLQLYVLLLFISDGLEEDVVKTYFH